MVTSDLSLVYVVDLISFSPEDPPASSEATVYPTHLQSNSSAITTKSIPSGSATKVHLRRGELLKLMFCQRLFDSFSSQDYAQNFDPIVSTDALVVTPIVPISTEATSYPANVINLDSLTQCNEF